MKTMQTEPAGTIGTTISGILLALFGILNASGANITDEMSGSITALVMGLIAIPAVAGWLTRFFVWAPENVQAVGDEAAATGQPPKIV